MTEEFRMTGPGDLVPSRYGIAPEDIASSLREFSKSTEMLAIDQPRLIDQYSRQWSRSVSGRGVGESRWSAIAHGEAGAAKGPLGDAIVRFTEKNQRTLIL